MTTEVFEEQMARMIDTFGAKAFPKSRVEEIFLVCGDIVDEAFTRIVTRFVQDGNVFRPPTVADFREHVRNEEKDRTDRGLSPIAKPLPVIEYATAQDAFEDVAKLWKETLSIEQAPPDFKAKIEACASEYYPALKEEVESLKRMVQAGSLEVRSRYVQKAKKLISFSALKVMIRGVKTIDGGETA